MNNNRTIMHIRRHIPTLLALLFLLTGGGTSAIAQNGNYSKDRPAVILCDWDFAPYEFSNNDGQPDGYNVQLLDLILTQLDIPHEFVTMDWTQALSAFEHREGDLIVDRAYNYHGRPYIRSNNTLDYYKVCIASLPETPRKTRLDTFTPQDTIVLKEDGYVSNRIVKERKLDIPIEYLSAKDAVASIASGKHKYFIWGKEPLLWKIKELAVDSLRLDSIDVPDGDIRIVGYDKDLIDAIDDEYARLEQSGELEKVVDRWFHPERIHNDTSPLALIILAGVIIIAIISFLLTRLIRFRVKDAVRKSAEVNSMMSQALSMGSNYVCLYDVKKDVVTNVYGNLLPHEMTMEEFISRVHPKDRAQYADAIKGIRNNCGQSTWTYTRRWNTGTAEKPVWRDLTGNATGETVKGELRYVVTAVRDVTQELAEEQLNRETGQKYMKMFDTNLIAMSFYSGDGYLIDLNDNMRKLCSFDKDSEAEQYFRNLSIFEVPMFDGCFDPSAQDDFHVCMRMYYPEVNIDKHIEIRIHPTFDEKGELRYYIVTARDLTEERQMYLALSQQEREITHALKEVERYDHQLNYLLTNSETFLWEYNLTTDEVAVSQSDHDKAFRAPLDQFCEVTYDGDPSVFTSEIRQATSQGIPYNSIMRFKHSPLEQRPGWYAISGIPVSDKEGQTTGYFGITRKITDLMEAQEKLKRETLRAESSGKMKSAFLANMTHEIRTPLNAIVGFSDLLQVVDTQEERMEFIRIIRNNCDMLMRLINDILEASNMGQALAIEVAEVDFARVFDDICQTLAQRVQEPGVEFIKDNPYDSYVTTLDKGRVQQVLTNFTTNAVKYTHEGHIKVGYRQERRMTRDEKGEAEGLYFYCEDTGAGIPKEKQASVFERFVKLNDFVQGTGLGLSICQNIADRCNGHIGVTSEGPGHGSTFWMWIPCERK